MRRSHPLAHHRAFTLVELTVATVILAVILLLVFSITQQTSSAWKNSASKIESYQGARAAFETISRKIGQATLNTYYDYFNAAGDRRTPANTATFLPAKYGRCSDLHFISGKSLLSGDPDLPAQITHSIFFNVPRGYTQDGNYEGASGTLNSCGYYIEYGDDPSRPSFLSSHNVPPSYRFRLMEFLQPTETTLVYKPYSLPEEAMAWFTGPLAVPAIDRPARALAQNIVAMVVLPRREGEPPSGPGMLAPEYEYDSRTTEAWAGGIQPVAQHQIPARIELTLVAIDQPSAIRLGNSPTAPDLGLGALFQQADKMDDDLRSAVDILRHHKPPLQAQVFRTSVLVRSAKWSE